MLVLGSRRAFALEGRKQRARWTTKDGSEFAPAAHARGSFHSMSPTRGLDRLTSSPYSTLQCVTRSNSSNWIAFVMAGEGPARDGSRGGIRASAIDRADHSPG